jgi:hypothetical protein
VLSATPEKAKILTESFETKGGEQTERNSVNGKTCFCCVGAEREKEYPSGNEQAKAGEPLRL